MAKDPAFLFYSKDWLEGTAELSPEAKGVYIDLLCYQHQRGDIPSDPIKLSRLTRLNVDEFNKIWPEIENKFNQMDNRSVDRLVNRRLHQVITERNNKSIINRINGTFASIIRNNKNIDKKTYSVVRKDFNASMFIEVPTERLTERITEWITNWLTEWLKNGTESIANGNVNYNKVFNNICEEEKIEISEEFRNVILTWLKYKSEKGQSYKPTGLKTLINNLIHDTNSNDETARLWIEHSMKNNYQGIYPPSESRQSSKEPPKYPKLK